MLFPHASKTNFWLYGQPGASKGNSGWYGQPPGVQFIGRRGGSAANFQNLESKSVFFIYSWGAWVQKWYGQYRSDRSVSDAPASVPVRLQRGLVATVTAWLGRYSYSMSWSIRLQHGLVATATAWLGCYGYSMDWFLRLQHGLVAGM